MKMTDPMLRQNVLDELAFNPGLNADDIGVTASAGVVTLFGHVGNYAEKWAAERCTERVKGVRAVAVELRVVPFEFNALGDDIIARRALQSLDWDARMPKDRVQIKVKKGWVTLSGDVDWNFQRVDAETDVRRLLGVLGVSNAIVVKSHPASQATEAEIKSRIDAAFRRSAEIVPGTVTVRLFQGHVTLSGKVATWHERRLAQNTAWSASGVIGVENLLTVV